MSQLFPNVIAMQADIWQATLETIYMTIASAVIAGVLGLLTGLVLVVTQPGGIAEDRPFYSILDNNRISIAKIIPTRKRRRP